MNAIRPATVLMAALLASWLPAWLPSSHAADTPPASAAQGRPGPVFAIGGALKADNAAVWQRVVTMAGGAGARFVVITAASAAPEQSAASIIGRLQHHGAVAEHLKVSPRMKGIDWRAAVRDPDVVAQVRAANGVYFSGGEQAYITLALEPSGQPTPVLEALRALHRRGGVIAGTSAGAAVMSSVMFADPPGVLDIMKFGLAKPKDVAPGLGFLRPDVFVDQHFLRRGRIGRMLAVLQQERVPLGFGVEENSAALFHGDTMEAIGSGGVLVVDMSRATTVPSVPAFNLRGARLSYLTSGDVYDVAARKAFPSANKRAGQIMDPSARDYSPSQPDEAFYPEMLGDNTLTGAMTNLIDNRQAEVLGVAFGAPNGKRAELGFEFRLSKGPDSLGLRADTPTDNSWAVLNLSLDVTPVLRPLPLYKAVGPGAASAPAR